MNGTAELADDLRYLVQRVARLEEQIDRLQRDLESRIRNLEADQERLWEQSR
jgi:hypothetical protein